MQCAIYKHVSGFERNSVVNDNREDSDQSQEIELLLPPEVSLSCEPLQNSADRGIPRLLDPISPPSSIATEITSVPTSPTGSAATVFSMINWDEIDIPIDPAFEIQRDRLSLFHTHDFHSSVHYKV